MMFSWLKTLLKMLFKPAIESSLRYHLSHYFVFFSIPIDVEDKLVGILDYLTDYKFHLMDSIFSRGCLNMVLKAYLGSPHYLRWSFL